MQKESFDITGMTCSACSSRVEKSVTGLTGVSEVSVNLLKNSMSVSFNPDATSTAAIAAAVVKAGYGAVPRSAKDTKTPTNTQCSAASPPSLAMPELATIRQRLAISYAFTLPLFYVAMGGMVGLPLPSFLHGAENSLALVFTQFLLTLPVLAVNSAYFRTGCKTLLSGAPNMDSLIAIGSGAATIFGVYAIYKMAYALGVQDMETAHHFSMNLYFESAAMILTLITTGK